MTGMIKVLYDKISEMVDMSRYQPKGDHPFQRLVAVQRMYIDAQNLIYMGRDGTKKRLLEESEFLARSFDEICAQKDRMTYLIDAVERGFGKNKGSEEGDAMKTFVRLQLSNEHLKEYVNQGVRTAVSAALNQLSQEDDRQTGCLTMERVFTLLEWTWRKVTCDSSGRVRKAEERETDTGRNQTALVACAAQIVAENAAKKGKTKDEMDRAQALAETAQLRKDYADLKNMFDQLKKRGEDLQKGEEQQSRGSYSRGGRQGPRGRGAPRGTGRGGWSKDTRKSNYRGAREGEDSQENDGEEKAFRVNIGKREFAGRARVRVLEEIQEATAMPTNDPKEEKRPKMPRVSQVTTRSMAKVIVLESEPEVPIQERASPAGNTPPEQDSLQETNEKTLRLTQEWDQEIPDEDLKKWAWGTGSAERYPPGEQHEAWRRHIANDKAAYHRRDDLLRVMAIAPRMDDKLDELLLLMKWPGDPRLDMELGEVWGTQLQGEALTCFRQLQEESNSGQRLGLVRSINSIRDSIRKEVEEASEKRMMEDPKYFWEVVHDRECRDKLEKELENLCENETDRIRFMDGYRNLVEDYRLRRGTYAHPEYDEEEAKESQGCYFDSGKAIEYALKTGILEKTYTMEELKTPIVYRPEGSEDSGEDNDENRLVVTVDGPRPGTRIKLVAYGCRRSPKEFLRLLQQPGRVAPPEGNGAAWSDGVAGLPIPEGCSSTARMYGQDGQPDTGDV